MRVQHSLLGSGLILVLAAGTWADDAKEQDFKPLFNISGWKIHDGRVGTWALSDDGVIFTRGGGGGWFMTEKEYGDFELRLEYRLSKGANSGVAVRSPLQGNPAYAGLEIQLQDDAAYRVPPEGTTGAIWDVAAPTAKASKPVGEWNALSIMAKGRRLAVQINGTQVLDVNLDDHKDRASEKPNQKTPPHSGLLRSRGHIGLQSWNGLVEFRNLRIKSLD